jgi:hypothetical protein
LKDPNERKLALHLLLCLLPKVHLDVLQVLLAFLRHVSLYSNAENGGNKMDISNLATVFAPNILYAKSSSEEDVFVSKRVVEELLIFQEDMRLVFMLSFFLF